jgi:hypothetical protein
VPKYKLRLPSKGDYLYSDDGYWFIGDTADEAFDFFREEMCEEDVEWVHPVILRGHVLYKADIDAGDCHEDAEPGDTTFFIVTDDAEKALAHELAPNEILAWVEGTPRPWWTYGPNGFGPDPTYHAHVGSDCLGEAFETREAADQAVRKVVDERVEAWKAAHPEFHRPVVGETAS